jgi:hypothetical protein
VETGLNPLADEADHPPPDEVDSLLLPDAATGMVSSRSGRRSRRSTAASA